MALEHHPRIVTNGLVGYWDAANTRSYSGSGNTWYDLTANGNNLTLTNSPTFNSSGYFSTGSTGYFTGAGSASIPTGNSSYTMLLFARLSTWADSRGFMSVGGFLVNNQSNALRTSTSTLGNMIHYWWGDDLSVSNNNGSIQNNQWFYVGVSFDGTTRKIYSNTVLVASDTPTSHNVTSNTIQLAKTYSTEYLQGDISLAQIYNRALTSAEVIQNYNATKKRYGL
jgi:hypothetical protein